MKVILLEDIDKLGKRGAVVSVKDGYGRNFLLPRKLATQATEGSLKRVEMDAKKYRVKEAKEEADATHMKSDLEKISLTISVKAGEGDVLFGSVTSADIAELLEKKGYTIDKRKIELDEPIKRLGTYQVPVRIFKSVSADIKLDVVKE
ncbi:MAG TPA: 50S ribosomal protein L9 [Acidobacteriota bacterium]|nr:50S ribosomal protein L9 [Acidobacteriota bacterium]